MYKISSQTMSNLLKKAKSQSGQRELKSCCKTSTSKYSLLSLHYSHCFRMTSDKQRQTILLTPFLMEYTSP